MDYEKEEKKELDQEREDLRKILSLPEGKRFFWRLLAETGLYQTSFDGEQTHGTAYRCGRREIGLWLLDEGLSVHPQAMSEIIIKNNTRKK